MYNLFFEFNFIVLTKPQPPRVYIPTCGSSNWYRVLSVITSLNFHKVHGVGLSIRGRRVQPYPVFTLIWFVLLICLWQVVRFFVVVRFDCTLLILMSTFFTPEAGAEELVCFSAFGFSYHEVASCEVLLEYSCRTLAG